MTAQIPDSITIPDKSFSIVGVNGSGLFDPSAYGMNPVPVMTACWRGYICHYKVTEERLILDTLSISLGTNEGMGRERRFVSQAGPVINGIHPFRKDSSSNNVYEDLNLDIPFTGGILAGDGFLQELYVHMGFHPAWKYQTVLELVLEGGKVLEIRDVSRQMEEMRKKMTGSPLQPDILKSDKKEVESWIEKTFRQDYHLDE